MSNSPQTKMESVQMASAAERLVEMRGLHKRFGAFIALNSIDLDVRTGEVLTLLGPSGCGKSTLLRIIAGFQDPSSGELLLRGKDMTATPPERRPVNMVFQRYALFPHLDVFDNIAFGLRIRRVPEPEIRSSVMRMIELVHLEGMAERWTHELSGGQSQRVALARALVNSPQVLLLDEPLAALDLKIRQHMLVELKRIQETMGTTFVYVTHDQDEAMILSSRIALMDHGKIEQLGTPDDLYFHPDTLFSAKFLGETNVLEGKVVNIGPAGVKVIHDNGVAVSDRPSRDFHQSSPVYIVVRPEAIDIRAASPVGDKETSENSCRGILSEILPIGARLLYSVRVEDGLEIRAQKLRQDSHQNLGIGDQVEISWNAGSVAILSR